MPGGTGGTFRKAVSWCAGLTERSSFVRFLLYGTWNTAWTFALYAVLVEVLRVNHLVAISIVWLLALIIGYVVNYLWVFRTDERLRFRRHLRRYLILFWGTFALNLALLSFMTDFMRVPPLPAQFIVFPVVVVLNFLGGRLWAFRAPD